MQRILFIKTSSLGDVVHNLPAVTDVCARNPQVTIDWVVEASLIDIPRLHPRIRRVIPIALRRWRKSLWKRSTWREMREFKRALQAETYDLVLDTQGLLKSMLLAKLAHGPACGQDAASAREPFFTFLYDRKFHIARGRNAVMRNRDLAAQALGYPLPRTSPDYGIQPPQEALSERLHTPYVVCLHGTSRASKEWPLPYWMSLAHELIRRGVTPVFPWGNLAEHRRACAVAESAVDSIVLPRLPLRRLAAVLGHAKGVVGMDTGLVHLAAALGRPTVALYTDTSPFLTGVYPFDERLAINLGDKGRIPAPAETIEALSRLGVL